MYYNSDTYNHIPPLEFRSLVEVLAHTNKEVKAMVGVVTPRPFVDSILDYPRTKYPVNIIGYNQDGDEIGTIDESKLTAVQRIILDAMVK